MNMTTAMNAIIAQLPPPQQEEFFEALNRTLLRCDIPGIPAPAPIKMPPPVEVEALGIPQIGHYYRQAYQTYAAS